MTLEDLKKWLEAADRMGVTVVRGPRPGDNETITVTLENVEQLAAEGRISLRKRKDAA